MGLEFGGNNDINKYALVAYKNVVSAPKVDTTTTDEANTPTNTKTDEYTYNGTQTNGDYSKLSETLLHGKTYSREQINNLNERLKSDDPEVKADAQEEYLALSNLFSTSSESKTPSNPSSNLNTPNIQLQYANFDQVYADADGFIYVAGRGLMPWSQDGQKYPTQEQLQKEADEALKTYLSTAVPVSAENLLSQIQATGKEPSPEEQAKIADLLKQEVANGSISREQAKEIKSKLSDAYTALIPDESPENESLRKEIKTLIVDLNGATKSDTAINTAWMQATINPDTEFQGTLPGQVEVLNNVKYSLNAQDINKRRENGFSVAYTPELEEEFAA